MKMSKIYPDLPNKIAEMAEGDHEFKTQLTLAIQNGIEELKEKYAKGSATQDAEIIQQIRHKVKPTLQLFGFDDLIDYLNDGKQILESEGFGSKFDLHAGKVDSQLAKALERLKSLS